MLDVPYLLRDCSLLRRIECKNYWTMIWMRLVILRFDPERCCVVVKTEDVVRLAWVSCERQHEMDEK